MRSQLALQMVIVSMPEPDPTGPLEKMALFDLDGNPIDLSSAGLAGPPGEDGADGSPGIDGAAGAPGVDGADGADAFTGEEFRAVTYVNETIVGSDVFAGFLPTANKKYHIEALLSGQVHLATTGLQLALLGPAAGIVRTALKVVSPSSAGDSIVNNLALNAYTTHTNSFITPALFKIEGIVEIGNDPDGQNIRIGARSEVAAALAVQIFSGSFMRWREI